MTSPLGPTGALKIAYELIDAQAAHIKNLERGHWSRETRADVQDKTEALETARKAEELGSCCAAGACDPCEDPDRIYMYTREEAEAAGNTGVLVSNPTCPSSCAATHPGQEHA